MIVILTYIPKTSKMSTMQPPTISYQPLLLKHKTASPARLFCGASLLLIAFLFLYFGNASASLPAFLLHLALTFLFALPACPLLFGRRSVIVDERQGQVTAVRNWRLFQQTAHYQLKDATTITVTECVKSDNSRTTIRYPIHLRLRDDTAVHLQTADTLEAAYQLAHPLATRWHIPIEEQYYLAP
jgi:hypothetical protein